MIIFIIIKFLNTNKMAPSRGEDEQQALFPDMRKCERDRYICQAISASETTIRGNMSANPVPAQVHLC